MSLKEDLEKHAQVLERMIRKHSEGWVFSVLEQDALETGVACVRSMMEIQDAVDAVDPRPTSYTETTEPYDFKCTPK